MLFKVKFYTGYVGENSEFEQYFDTKEYCEADIEEILWHDCIEHARSYGHEPFDDYGDLVMNIDFSFRKVENESDT